jgi:hypothetical protein
MIIYPMKGVTIFTYLYESELKDNPHLPNGIVFNTPQEGFVAQDSRNLTQTCGVTADISP